MELQKSKLGTDHLETLSSINNLAIMYSDAGRQSEVLQLTEEVVKVRKSKLRGDHPDALISMLGAVPSRFYWGIVMRGRKSCDEQKNLT